MRFDSETFRSDLKRKIHTRWWHLGLLIVSVLALTIPMVVYRMVIGRTLALLLTILLSSACLSVAYVVISSDIVTYWRVLRWSYAMVDMPEKQMTCELLSTSGKTVTLEGISYREYVCVTGDQRMTLYVLDTNEPFVPETEGPIEVIVKNRRIAGIFS